MLSPTITSFFDKGDKKSHAVMTQIKTAEKNMAGLQNVLGGYLRNQERIRKKCIKMSTILRTFADSETEELGHLLSTFSAMMIESENERNKLIEREQVLSEDLLKMYPTLCSKLKEEVRKRDSAIDKETKKQQSLDKTMLKEAGNRPKISQSQLELAGASKEVMSATANLAESVKKFEIQMREDVKTAISEFLWSEMNYHARALELLTECHQAIGIVEFDSDIESVNKKYDSILH